jgi:hypothetical protein
MNSDQKGFPEIKIKRINKPPYIINKNKLDRFNNKNIVFERVMWDSSWEGYNQMYDEKVLEIIDEKKPGYSRFDFALAYASWIVHDAFKGSFSWTKIEPFRTPVDTIGIDWTKMRVKIDDPAEMSGYIKRGARLIGASLVGICKLKKDWLYKGVEIPKRFENAIVIAIEMDLKAIETSPAVPAAIATAVGYSKMGFILACMGEFIRNLGYDAIQCGNDTALSVPLAIDAGLGELGRNGLLITPHYGPRVRLCKIFTDLPLEPDKPIDFGVKKYCEMCKLCAKHCEAKAISMEDEPNFDIACRSNNMGALKWYVNTERCYLYWCENGIDCSTCIKVCPYNQLPTGEI